MSILADLEKVENEKISLEDEISKIRREKERNDEKLMINIKNAETNINQLKMEKNDVYASLESMKEDLHTTVLDKKKLTNLNAENEKRLSEIIDKYQDAVQKIEKLTLIQEKYFELTEKVKELEDNIQRKSEILDTKESKIKELYIVEEKYAESLEKITELKDLLLTKSEELSLKELKIKELYIIEEKYAESLNKITEIEGSLLTKSEELSLKEEELKSIKEKNPSMMAEIMNLECRLKENTELLDVKEKEISDLRNRLNENKGTMYKLQYENIEMKDNLEKEKDSVKICLECELMNEKIKELDDLKLELIQTQEEVRKQTQLATDTMKMLSETEDNFDNMRVRKEKEIIKYKDNVQTLQHELKILKVQVGEIEELRIENERMKINIEEMTLQNAGDLQRIKSENDMLKKDVGAFKIQKNLSLPVAENKNTSSQKSKESNSQQTKTDEKMEADSSRDDSIFVKGKKVAGSLPALKRSYKSANKKAINSQNEKTPMTVEKKKRMWESDSSGSECLEIVFDSEANKIKGFTPKSRPVDLPAVHRLNFMQDKKMYIQEIINKTPCYEDNNKPVVINIDSKPLQIPMKTETDSDFLSCKTNVTEVYLTNSPYLKRKSVMVPDSPSTPIQRKFFKTPLKEREFPFKKPQSNSRWF